MGNDVTEKIEAPDKEMLIEKMVKALPGISGELNMMPAGIAVRAGLDVQRVRQIISGKRKMKWSEYMAILFVLWEDENGRTLAEENGLFPEELKSMMRPD